MKRPLHNLLATCRSVRQAVALWKRVRAAFGDVFKPTYSPPGVFGSGSS